MSNFISFRKQRRSNESLFIIHVSHSLIKKVSGGNLIGENRKKKGARKEKE